MQSWFGYAAVIIFLRHLRQKEARHGAGPLKLELIGDQLLTNAPPLALHAASDAIEKPWPLQAFRPLQEFDALLHALWPLQALAAMHLPWAASAGVDTVETAAPARNSVAAAAASVAPDLESNFMTFSSMEC
jgi:hypothetical protein